MKILSLNLSAYKNWQIRKPKVLALFKEHAPDIIFLQEVRMDPQQNSRRLNQLEEINEELNYPYSVFSSARLYENNTVQHGCGALSRFPILNTRTYMLSPQKAKYAYSTRVYMDMDIKIEDTTTAFTLVHFENTNEGSLNHLKEVLAHHKALGRKAVIMGDFNILDISLAKEFYKDNYKCSYDYSSYVSYPEKSETLDYCLIPSDYSFLRVEVVGEDVSDHKALACSIVLNT